MVHVVAAITVTAGKRDPFLAEFRELVPQVRAEEGCRGYAPCVDATTDIDRQDAAGPDVVTVVEQWESVDHLGAHLAALHMVDFRERVGHLIESTQLRILVPA